MPRDTPQKPLRLSDYRPPNYLVDRVELYFDVGADATKVHATMQVRRNPQVNDATAPLVLDGRQVELTRVALDGVALTPHLYQLDAEQLTIPDVPERFKLSIGTRIRPQDNTELEGLYASGNFLLTQCEAEGFRKITYFIDRPDVLSLFTTTVEADYDLHPVLLSNGNLVDSGRVGGDRHWARWEDPVPKPSYLFALVAGDLGCLEDQHVTRSGRRVNLCIYADYPDLHKCGHALSCLKRAMRWDEERFGLEYDLDNYNLVVTDDFNMGAMENKGLNIFNAKYALATPETASDEDYKAVETIVGHEYFHNWTGNRVSCRDWFQLTLKEGLTVFRDQEFSSDMRSRAVKRIEDARRVRSIQFAEDAGPMAHPVRPEQYIEIGNFYTPTVYDKGAEVVRMYHTLLGDEGFRRGLSLYLERHDGQAVICEDFLDAMAEANDRDLSQFALWYSQAGTPTVEAEGSYDADGRRYTLTLRQSCPPTPGQPEKSAQHIPIAVGLLDDQGHEMALRMSGEDEAGGHTRVLELTDAEQQFCFEDVRCQPLPSLLRGFSAPVRLRYDYTQDDLAFLMRHDADAFNRWDAATRLATDVVVADVEARRRGQRADQRIPKAYVEALRAGLTDPGEDRALVAEMLTLPGEDYIAEELTEVDPQALHEARQDLRRELARDLRDELAAAYEANARGDDEDVSPQAMARRSIKTTCLDMLLLLEGDPARDWVYDELGTASNMTDYMAAVVGLLHHGMEGGQTALSLFYQRYQRDPHVLDKWLTIQATSPQPGTLERVKLLMRHPIFSIRNPNKVRALLGAFAQYNPVHFHALDGSGYDFIAEQALVLDRLNPQMASRLIAAFNQWRRYEPTRRELMREQLERVLGSTELSPDSYEIASKALA